jgi:hypothetical protein
MLAPLADGTAEFDLPFRAAAREELLGPLVPAAAGR